MKNAFLNFVKITGFIPYGLYLKPRIYKQKKKSKVGQSAEIVIANHTNLLDFALLAFLYRFKVVRVLMAEVLYKGRFNSFFMNKIRGIRMNRNDYTDTTFLPEAIETLKSGGIVGVFPEGRLNPQGMHFGKMLTFRQGAAYLALTTGAPVRPVYLHLNPGILKSSSMLVGEPIDLRALYGSQPSPDALAEATQYLRHTLDQMRKDLRLRTQHKQGSIVSRYLKWSVRRALFLGLRVKYHYEDEQAQARVLKAPSVVVGNHTSFFDPPLLAASFPGSTVHVLAAEELFRKKSMSWLMNRFGSIKIDRSVLDMDSFNAISTVLKRGDSVAIFPEGSLGEDGQLREFKPGFILSAMHAKAQVLPVYILPKRKIFLQRQHVWIGKPITLEGEMTPQNVKLQAQRVRSKMVALEAKARSTIRMES